MARKRKFEKEKVVLKAMKLFWEKGYNGTSMENLVSSLGINRASMYGSFGSKTNLYNLSVQEYSTIKITGVEKVFGKQQNVRKGFSELFKDLLNQNEADVRGCFIVNTTTELGGKNTELDNTLKEYGYKMITAFKNYLSYGAAQGQISPYKDLEMISKYFYHLENGLQVALMQEVKKEELIKTVQMALSVLG